MNHELEVFIWRQFEMEKCFSFEHISVYIMMNHTVLRENEWIMKKKCRVHFFEFVTFIFIIPVCNMYSVYSA